MIQKLFGVAAAALLLAPVAGAAETCDKAVCKLQTLWLVAPIASVLALIVAVVFYKKMMSANEGSDKMKEIAGYVREGAMAYLFRQYKIVSWVFAVLFVLFAVLAYFGLQNPFVPVAFLTGGFFSGLCGYIGMRTATAASNRTAQAASEGLNRGLQVAFRSGAVMGLVVVGRWPRLHLLQRIAGCLPCPPICLPGWHLAGTRILCQPRTDCTRGETMHAAGIQRLYPLGI